MIKALIGGDVWLAPPLNDKIEEIKLSLKKITKDNIYDIFICNLEAPFKSSQIRTNRRALLYSKPYLLNAFNIADKNILLLANNHINDYGPKGLIKTIEGCKDKGFLIVGAGKNIEPENFCLLFVHSNFCGHHRYIYAAG